VGVFVTTPMDVATQCPRADWSASPQDAGALSRVPKRIATGCGRVIEGFDDTVNITVDCVKAVRRPGEGRNWHRAARTASRYWKLFSSATERQRECPSSRMLRTVEIL